MENIDFNFHCLNLMFGYLINSVLRSHHNLNVSLIFQMTVLVPISQMEEYQNWSNFLLKFA